MRALIAEADARGLKLCACHQNRFNKSIQKIRSAVEEKRFGRMLHGTVHVRWNRGEEYYRQAPWRGTWAMDGGALMNQCIHSIDLLRWMLGDGVTEVMAYTDNLNHPYIQAEDLGLALVRFESGAYGVVEGTTNVYPHNLEETLYLFGENGTVKAGGKSVNIIEEWDIRDGRGDPATIKMQFGENPPNVNGYGHTPFVRTAPPMWTAGPVCARWNWCWPSICRRRRTSRCACPLRIAPRRILRGDSADERIHPPHRCGG